MEKVEKYRHWIMEVLTEFADPGNGSSSSNVEEQLIFDPVRDHYQVLAIGWDENERVNFPIVHFDIKDGKIWVQENSTDVDVVGELEARGVPKSDIVLAFHAPSMRKYTAYAVA